MDDCLLKPLSLKRLVQTLAPICPAVLDIEHVQRLVGNDKAALHALLEALRSSNVQDFQQLSELLHVQGIQIAGPLPPAIQITTTFSAGIGAHSQQVDAARALLAYLASPAAAEAKRKQGMEPA